jgi:hypothetical protein
MLEGLDFMGRNVSLLGEKLAPLIMTDQLLGIGDS